MNTLVIADLHFSVFSPDYRVMDFLHEKSDRYETVILLGDTFEFYFPFRDFIPKSAALLLKGLSDISRKCRILMIQGNHDPWPDDYFTNFGIELVQSPYRTELFGRHYRFMHGHELFMHIPKNRMVHSILTNKMNMKLFSLISPFLAYRLGEFITRGYSSSVTKERMIEIVEERIPDGDEETLIMGHVHRPHISSKNKIIIAGDFTRTGSYCSIIEEGAEIEYL